MEFEIMKRVSNKQTQLTLSKYKIHFAKYINYGNFKSTLRKLLTARQSFFYCEK